MTSKVFVGNLAFQTTDQALAEAFQDCGKVKSGVVITRGRRSLGYGFVEFESHESALEAVKSKNNVELKGRHLKVELASENPVRPNLERGPSGAGGGNPNPGRSSSPGQGGISSAAAANQNPGSAGDNAGGPSGQRRKQRPFPPRNQQQQQQQQQRRKGPVKAVVVDNTQNPNSNPGSNNKAPQNPSTGSNPASGGNPPAGNNKPTAAGGDRSSGDNNSRRPPRPPRERRERNYNKKTYPETRVLSKTAVFVANLPFNVKDDELTNFFKDNKPKAAHVVTTRTGRSRGYGFVDFETENDQQAAILSKNNLMFPQSDRQITVTASYKTQEVVVNVV